MNADDFSQYTIGSQWREERGQYRDKAKYPDPTYDTVEVIGAPKTWSYYYLKDGRVMSRACYALHYGKATVHGGSIILNDDENPPEKNPDVKRTEVFWGVPVRSLALWKGYEGIGALYPYCALSPLTPASQ